MKDTTLKAIQANHDAATGTVHITYTGKGLQVNTVGKTREDCEAQAKEEVARVWKLNVVGIDNTEIG